VVRQLKESFEVPLSKISVPVSSSFVDGWTVL